MTKMRFLLFSLVLVVAASALIAQTADNNAAGTLTVAGKATKLAYSYAFAQKGTMDPKSEDILLIISDAPLGDKALEDRFERSKLEKEGKLHCVEAILNSEKQATSVTVRHSAFKTPCSGGSTEDIFEAKTFDGKVVDGRLYRKTPGKSFDDIPYTYDATFNVTIVRKGK